MGTCSNVEVWFYKVGSVTDDDSDVHVDETMRTVTVRGLEDISASYSKLVRVLSHFRPRFDEIDYL